MAILKVRDYIWGRGYIEVTWLYYGDVAILRRSGYIEGMWLYYGDVVILWGRG